MSIDLPGGRDHPTWQAAAGVLVGYSVILGVILAVMFLVPYALWTVLA